MGKIKLTKLEELHTALGKQCTVSFNVVGLPSDELTGILTNIQIDPHNYSLRVVLKIENASLAIPFNSILSFEMEE